MKHRMDYGGLINDYFDFMCPTCGRHVRYPVEGGLAVVLNYGDTTVMHTGAAPGLSMSAEVKQEDDPWLEPFIRGMSK